MADTTMAKPDRIGPRGSARHHSAVASLRISGLLALEISRPTRETQSKPGISWTVRRIGASLANPKCVPADEQRQPVMGRPAHRRDRSTTGTARRTMRSADLQFRSFGRVCAISDYVCAFRSITTLSAAVCRCFWTRPIPDTDDITMIMCLNRSCLDILPTLVIFSTRQIPAKSGCSRPS
jgi:hypothetical protein